MTPAMSSAVNGLLLTAMYASGHFASRRVFKVLLVVNLLIDAFALGIACA